MHRSPVQALSILLLGVALLSACQTEGQPSGVTTAPLALTPAATPSGGIPDNAAGSAPSLSVGATTSAKPGVLFRDDFDAPTVDTSKWKVYEKSGVVRQKDGWLEALSVAGGEDFPFVVGAQNIIPETGGWYFETRAQWFNAKNLSTISTLNLDVLPPSGPTDSGFAPPTLQVRPWYYKPRVIFRTGSQVIEKDSDSIPNEPFTLRIESDTNDNYRILIDEKILVEANSSRRPRNFWIGHYPNTTVPQADWLHWRVDYIETGSYEKSQSKEAVDSTTEQNN